MSKMVDYPRIHCCLPDVYRNKQAIRFKNDHFPTDKGFKMSFISQTSLLYTYLLGIHAL